MSSLYVYAYYSNMAHIHQRVCQCSSFETKVKPNKNLHSMYLHNNSPLKNKFFEIHLEIL